MYTSHSFLETDTSYMAKSSKLASILMTYNNSQMAAILKVSGPLVKSLHLQLKVIAVSERRGGSLFWRPSLDGEGIWGINGSTAFVTLEKERDTEAQVAYV